MASLHDLLTFTEVLSYVFYYGYCGSGAAFDSFKKGFDRTVSRGPDDSRIIDTGKGLLGFHRKHKSASVSFICMMYSVPTVAFL